LRKRAGQRFSGELVAEAALVSGLIGLWHYGAHHISL
jgi:hypothetical protein